MTFIEASFSGASALKAVRFFGDVQQLSYKCLDVYKRQEKGKSLSFYAEVDIDGVFFGMGFYAQNRPLMDALRARMRRAPDQALSLLAPLEGDFVMHGERFRRMAVPEELPEGLRDWYLRKSFYLEKTLPFQQAESGALAGTIAAGFMRLKPLYDYVSACAPEEEE